MRHHRSSASLLLLALGLSSAAVACGAPPASTSSETGEDDFTAPRVKEIMSAESIGLVASAVDGAGGVHAVVRTGAEEIWYATNAGAERRWTTKKITTTAELLAQQGYGPSPGWVALQQIAIAVDEDRKVSILFDLDTDASGERLHTLMALEAINGSSPLAAPVIVASGKHDYDLALGASRGRLLVAYSSADPNATKMDEVRYRATPRGASAFGPEVSVACTGDAPGDWTTRKQLKVESDATGRAHVLCAGGKTVSHAAELTPGSGEFGAGEVVPNPETSYPDRAMMGVAADGTPHVTLVTNGSLGAVHRGADGQWARRTYFDESVGQPPLGPWEAPTYPVVTHAAQAFDRDGRPVRVAVIDEQSKDGMLEKQTIAYFGPDLARHDVADVDIKNPVWNLTLAVSPANDDAIVLFTTLGKGGKLMVIE